MINSASILKLSFVIILIPIGILTKIYTGFGSEFFHNYLGGVIYMCFFIVLTSLFFPQSDPIKITLIVLIITCMIEFSQLIQASFMISLRKHFIIQVLIGSVFNYFDFVFYLAGAGIGFGILCLIKNKTAA